MNTNSIIIFFLKGLLCISKICNGDILSAETKIVGGQEVTNRAQFPYQVSLRYKSDNYHFCGGSIIHLRAVLSAAHCFETISASETVAVVGDLDKSIRTSETTIRNIDYVISHPNYNSTSYDNDISVVITSDKFRWSNTINLIPLAGGDSIENSNCTISGWGSVVNGGSTVSILRYAVVPIVSRNQCIESYRRYLITDAMICAGYGKGGVDSCRGDSGGPLTCNNKLTGIVSWGAGCAIENYYGVYTNVSYFNDWIEENIRNYLINNINNSGSNVSNNYVPSKYVFITFSLIFLYLYT